MKAIKLIAYILLSVCLLFSGKAFLTDFNRVTEQSAAIGAARSMDDIDHSGYANAVIVNENPFSEAVEPTAPDEKADPESNIPDISEEVEEVNAPDAQAASSNAEKTSHSTTESSNRMGYYGGIFVITLIALGLLAGYDFSQYSANRVYDSLYNDDGGGMDDDGDLYESAEQEWARGDFLEAIRILREYLAANPKQQHAAIRIAEIYEKDLKNPLAAVLEYEEILTQKLTPNRWGWSAIHLANLYSGPMDKPEKAIQLLRDLVEKYPETSAADKANQRLELIDNGTDE